MFRDNMKGDIENNEIASKPLLDTFPAQVRAKFIQKVYSLLSLQLMLTFSLSAWFMFDEDAAEFVTSEHGVILHNICMISSFVSLLTLYCCLLHSHPANMILLLLFTFSMAYEVGFISVLFKSHGMENLIFIALGITMTIFLSLTSFVMITKRDFEFLSTFLYISLLSLLLFSFIFIFIPINISIYHIIMGYAGTLIFSGYILYDTSQLIHKLTPDDYIEGTIQLYLDIINLFFSILNILQSTSNQ